MSDPALIGLLQDIYSKGNLKVESNHCSGYSLPNLSTTHCPESISKPFVENLGPITSSMRSHVLSNTKTQIFDPDLLKSIDDLKFIETASTMLNKSIAMPHDPNIKAHYVASLNSPQISFLNDQLTGNVILFGMDSQEADLVRIDKAAALNNFRPYVFAVDHRFKVGEGIRGHFSHISGVYLFSSIESFLSFVKSDADLIQGVGTLLFNHTFTSFCSGDNASLRELLIYVRKNCSGARLFGTYMDPASIIAERAAGVIAEEAIVEYLGLVTIEGRTYHKLRVIDQVYYDSIFRTEDLYSLFKSCGWDLHIYHSSRFISKYGGIKKTVRKNLSTIQCLRVALALPTYTMDGSPRPHWLHLDDDSDISKFNKGRHNFAIVEPVPATSLPSFPVRKNKGVPLNGKDITCLGDSFWWGQKVEGFHVQMIARGDRLCVSSGLGSFILKLGGNVRGACYLEGEMVVSPAHYKRPVSVESKEFLFDHIVVFDGLPLSMNVEDPFVSRWREIEGFIFANADLLGCLRLQVWYPSDVLIKNNIVVPDPETLYDECEGIVVQPMFSPPGKFRNGFGSARYIKRNWSYEVRDITRGVIIEIDAVTKKHLRDRPDRTLPSTLEDIYRIQSSISFKELVMFSLLMRKYYTLQSGKSPLDPTLAKPYFIANSEEYLTVLCKDVLTGNSLGSRQNAAFVELTSDIVCSTEKEFLFKVCNWDDKMTVLNDGYLLERAKKVLKASENSGTLVDVTMFSEDIGDIRPPLQDVAFEYVPSFIVDVHLKGSTYNWIAVVITRLEDSIFNMVRRGDDVDQSSIYLFRSTPVTMDVVTIPYGKVRNVNKIKKTGVLNDLPPGKYNKKFLSEYIMPSVLVTGLDISDVVGDTLEERLASAKKLVVGNKASTVRVIVKFLIRKEVFMSAPNVFPALEQAIRAAQLQYHGVVSVGI